MRESIRVDSGPPLFFRHWTYVETIEAVGGYAVIGFNSSSWTPGPFLAELTWTDVVTGHQQVERVSDFMAQEIVPREIPAAMQRRPVRLRLTLNGNLAFLGRLDPTTDVLF